MPREGRSGVFPRRGRDLTTASGNASSAQYGDNPGLACLSVAGSGRQAAVPTAPLLLLFHHFIFAITGKASDGLVTVDSAQWGTFDPQTWPADHLEKVGYNLDNPIVLPVSLSHELGPIAANVAPLDYEGISESRRSVIFGPSKGVNSTNKKIRSR